MASRTDINGSWDSERDNFVGGDERTRRRENEKNRINTMVGFDIQGPPCNWFPEKIEYFDF